MKQLELFTTAPSRMATGLRLLRCELELQFEIQGYRAQLRKLNQWDDPEYVRQQTNCLIRLIQLCYDSLDFTRAQRKLL